MDHGIWATWYDLEERDRGPFIEWLHGEYLPALKARPGYAWVAHYQSQGGGAAMQQVRETIIERPQEDIGSGSQFLMLVGAPSAHTFLNPSVLEVARGADARARDMLALRKGVRTGIFAEEARVSGPAARERAARYDARPGNPDGQFSCAHSR